MWQVSGFLWFLPPINWLPRYNWNIVESGVKHHNPNPPLLLEKTEISGENHRIATCYYQVSLVTDWNETRNCIGNRNWLHRKRIQLSMITAMMAPYIKHIICSMYLLCALNYIVTFPVCDILHTPENIYLKIWYGLKLHCYLPCLIYYIYQKKLFGMGYYNN